MTKSIFLYKKDSYLGQNSYTSVIPCGPYYYEIFIQNQNKFASVNLCRINQNKEYLYLGDKEYNIPSLDKLKKWAEKLVIKDMAQIKRALR